MVRWLCTQVSKARDEDDDEMIQCLLPLSFCYFILLCQVQYICCGLFVGFCGIYHQAFQLFQWKCAFGLIWHASLGEDSVTQLYRTRSQIGEMTRQASKSRGDDDYKIVFFSSFATFICVLCCIVYVVLDILIFSFRFGFLLLL